MNAAFVGTVTPRKCRVSNIYTYIYKERAREIEREKEREGEGGGREENEKDLYIRCTYIKRTCCKYELVSEESGKRSVKRNALSVKYKTQIPLIR